MGDDLGCNSIQKYGEQAVCKATYMMRVKGSDRRPFIFIFRLSIVLHDSYQLEEVAMEIKEWEIMSGTLTEFY